MQQWKTTVVFKTALQWYKSNSDLLVLEGGTSSSKTYSVIMALCLWAMTDTAPTLTSIVGETVPKLKAGPVRDLVKILGTQYDRSRWNATDRIYTFKNGSKIEFISADDPAKMRGPRRDRLYINEANTVAHESFKQLNVRTNLGKTIIDHNPVGEYWAHEYQGSDNVWWHHSTYLDAMHVLPRAVVLDIESRKDKDPNWWRVYGLGLVGNVEGLVHPNFAQIDIQPDSGDEVYGLDFGFSNDETAILRIDVIGDKLYCDELLYEKGLTNSDLITRLPQIGIEKGRDLIIADNARPESIKEISCHGYSIIPSKKGKDSVYHGIQKVNQYRQYWTKRSINGIKEQRNYKYIQDRDGRYLNTPVDMFNHLMDARRYAIQRYSSPSRYESGNLPI